MFRAALMFFLLGLTSIIFGANEFAGVTMEVGRIMLFVCLDMTVITLLTGLIAGDSEQTSLRY